MTSASFQICLVITLIRHCACFVVFRVSLTKQQKRKQNQQENKHTFLLQLFSFVAVVFHTYNYFCGFYFSSLLTKYLSQSLGSERDTVGFELIFSLRTRTGFEPEVLCFYVQHWTVTVDRVVFVIPNIVMCISHKLYLDQTVGYYFRFFIPCIL